jgi:hypothetical protein
LVSYLSGNWDSKSWKIWQELLGEPFKITGGVDPDLEEK